MMRRCLILLCSLNIAASAWLTGPVLASAPTPTAEAMAPRTEAEAAVQTEAMPIGQRLTLRNEAGRYDVWLVSGLDFEKLSEKLRKAVSARRDLGDGWRLEQWTYLESDRSYVGSLVGQGEYKLRLSRHLAGSLVELENAGNQADALPWAPPYRPRPVLLMHGSVR